MVIKPFILLGLAAEYSECDQELSNENRRLNLPHLYLAPPLGGYAVGIHSPRFFGIKTLLVFWQKIYYIFTGIWSEFLAYCMALFMLPYA